MKKKTALLITIFIVLIVVIGGLVLFQTPNKIDYSIREYSVDKLPSFSLTISSTHANTINLTKNELKDKSIKVYEFAKDIDNNWETVTNDYIGIKFKDILETYNLDHNNIEFYEVDKYSVRFTADEINDDVYIIFFRDGKSLGDIEPISLVSFNEKWDKSLTDINFVFIHQSFPVEIPSEDDNNIDLSDDFVQ